MICKNITYITNGHLSDKESSMETDKGSRRSMYCCEQQVAVSFWVAPRKEESAAEQRDYWNNGDLVLLDDGAFRDSLRRNGSNLFEGCQEFANMFVVGLLDHPMVNLQVCLSDPCAALVSITRFYADLWGHSQQALSTQCISSQ